MSSKQQVKTAFSARAVQWATYYSDLGPGSLEEQNLIARQRLALEAVAAALPPSAKVLDVGCGTGALAAKLMRRGYEVWGLDIAEPMIRYARDRCGSDRFRVGDIEDIPFADNTFDAAVCLGVIEWLDTDERALREIWRVLKPGGRAVVSTPSAICPLYQMDRALVRLEAALRPLYYLAKYRLRGRRNPTHQHSAELINRRYYRGRWLRLLRSVGLEPEQCICHGWGWYRSRLGHLVQSLAWTGRLVRRGLERFFGEARLRRMGESFVRNRALNWLASEQLVRVRAVK